MRRCAGRDGAVQKRRAAAGHGGSHRLPDLRHQEPLLVRVGFVQLGAVCVFVYVFMVLFCRGSKFLLVREFHI